MATENLIEFGGDSQRSSDSELRGVAQVAPGESSDHERRRSVIIILINYYTVGMYPWASAGIGERRHLPFPGKTKMGKCSLSEKAITQTSGNLQFDFKRENCGIGK